MKELVEKVWKSAGFRKAVQQNELAWLRRELGSDSNVRDSAEAVRLMQAAAILACSESPEHRQVAFRVATRTYDLYGTRVLPLDQALRVILTRLGNFPSLATRVDVETAYPLLPLSLAAEEISASEDRKVLFGQEPIYLTDFQHSLWTNLAKKNSLALAAPTSAGKSFVLQNYLASAFKASADFSVIYIVPTRALIAQVAEDLADCFNGFDQTRPEIVTVPLDSEAELPRRVVYVLTQERVQLGLISNSEFKADLIVVDEAHSIADGSRGILLQWVVDDLLVRNKTAQILFASPNIRNLDVFARLFGLSDVIEFSSIEPTVAQNFLLISIVSATGGLVTVKTAGDGARAPEDVMRITVDTTLASRVEKLVHLSVALGKGQSNIVYANGAADAEEIAMQIADLLSDREPTAEQLALVDLARESVHQNYVLAECVKRGVAFHYSNIPAQLRRAIEKAASAGHIDYLVCTSTLLQGVNLPAKNMFMCLPEKGRLKPLESTDFWNLSGRAGRLRREFQGNIFLIDYEKWKKKPLEGPKNALVIPAIETSIAGEQGLLNVIEDKRESKATKDSSLESAFVRLFADHRTGKILTTLSRAGVAEDSDQFVVLTNALRSASEKVTLPTDVVKQTPTISAHKQQRLYENIAAAIAQAPESVRDLIPRHPRESEAYDSYVLVLKRCYELILEIDTSRGLHRFHAVIAKKWMLGISLPQIIDEQISRHPNVIKRTSIRNTLDLIEKEIRFQAVRLFGCYTALLTYALSEAGMPELARGIPALALYMEIGASDRTMISFISLGLSRVTAMKLNSISARKDLDVPAALEWLKGRAPETLDLSPLLLAEVLAVTR